MGEPGGGRARQSSPPVGRLEEPRPRSAPPQPRFEGQLNKFTNVVKGWQYRWFVLSPESGRLEYYLLEEKNGRCRGSQQLAGSVVLPSEEDSQTFTVNFASGEVYKVRASHAKERQVWVDRLRACAYRHQELLGGTGAGLGSAVLRPLTPPGSRSHITNGEPSTQLQTLSLSVLDAFGSVHDIVHKVERRHAAVAEAIESLPAGGVARPGEERTRATCHQPSLLLLKATSQATLRGVESALGVLQELRGSQLAPPVVVHQSIPLPTAFSAGAGALMPGSPAHRPALSSPATPSHRPRPKSADTARSSHH